MSLSTICGPWGTRYWTSVCADFDNTGYPFALARNEEDGSHKCETGSLIHRIMDDVGGKGMDRSSATYSWGW